MDEFIAPIQDKALILLTSAVKTAHDKGIYNKCARQAGTWAARLSPEQFPLTGEPLVVPVRHQDSLLSPHVIRRVRGQRAVDFGRQPAK